jgi:hypothetical protein
MQTTRTLALQGGEHVRHRPSHPWRRFPADHISYAVWLSHIFSQINSTTTVRLAMPGLPGIRIATERAQRTQIFSFTAKQTLQSSPNAGQSQ